MQEMFLIFNRLVKYFDELFLSISMKIFLFCFHQDSTQTLISQLSNATRLSCGVGVVLNLMNVARLELNYTLPLWTQVHDRFVC